MSSLGTLHDHCIEYSKTRNLGLKIKAGQHLVGNDAHTIYQNHTLSKLGLLRDLNCYEYQVSVELEHLTCLPAKPVDGLTAKEPRTARRIGTARLR